LRTILWRLNVLRAPSGDGAISQALLEGCFMDTTKLVDLGGLREETKAVSGVGDGPFGFIE